MHAVVRLVPAVRDRSTRLAVIMWAICLGLGIWDLLTPELPGWATSVWIVATAAWTWRWWVTVRAARQGPRLDTVDQLLVSHMITEHTKAMQDVLALMQAAGPGEAEARAAIRATETLIAVAAAVQVPR